MKTNLLILFSLLFSLNLFASQNCEETHGTGYIFNTEINDCVLNQGSTSSIGKADACKGLTEEEYRNCFKNNVNTSLEDNGVTAGGEDPEGKGWNITANAFTTAVGIYSLTRLKKLNACGSASIMILAGAGVTAIIGEYAVRRKYFETLDNDDPEKLGLRQLYSQDVEAVSNGETETTSSDDMIVLVNNQKRAFDFQIDQEKARKKAHNARKTIHNIAGGLYAGAAAVAIYEALAKGWTIKDCKTKGTPETPKAVQNLSSPMRGNNTELLVLADPETFGSFHYINNFSIEEIVEVSLRKLSNFIIPNANAQFKGDDYNEKFMSELGDDAGLYDDKGNLINKKTSTTNEVKNLTDPTTQAKANNVIDRIIGSPITRIAMSGLMSWYSFATAKGAGENADEAQQRIEAIEEIKAGFLTAANATNIIDCTEMDRRTQSKPRCYCFLSDNTPNPARKNSSICKSLHAGNIDKAGDYGANSTYASDAPRGCLVNGNKYKEKCNCKKEKCTTFSGNLKLGPLANVSSLKNLLRKANGFNQGRLTTDKLRGDKDSKQMAAYLKKMQDKLKKDPKTKKVADQILKLRKQMDKKFNNIARQAVQSGAINPNSLASAGIGSSSVPTSAKDVFKSAKAALKKENLDLAAPKKGNTLADFDFGDESGGGVDIIDDNSDIMKKEFKVDDISAASHVSIFKMISNRYQMSGMKRLFEEDKDEK